MSTPIPVSLTSQLVTRISFDYAITLLTEEGVELRLETQFTFTEPDSEPIVIDPERPDAAALKVLGLLHKVIRAFHVAESGSLVLAVEGGSGIRTEADDAYEAWTIAGRRGEKVVCLPGGELAIWNAVTDG